MIPGGFALLRPTLLAEALELKGEYGPDALALAGGTVLVPELRLRRGRPVVVLDLSRIGLNGIVVDASETQVGATATYTQVLAMSAGSVALEALAVVAAKITGGPQTRNRATIGGSAAYANPSSDMPAALAALHARFTLASSRGKRVLDASSFFVDSLRTGATDDELLVAITIPEPPEHTGFAYEKLKFGESSWPIATATCLARADGTRRLVVGGCTPVPLIVEFADVDELHETVLAGLTDPLSDELAPGTYRQRVAPVVARRAFQAAIRAHCRSH